MTQEFVTLPREVVEHALETLSNTGTQRGKQPSQFLAEGFSMNALRAALEQPQDKHEPVGEAGPMPGADGFTMACFRASDVSVGTELYTHPQNLRCKSNQARLATLWGYVKADQPQSEQEPVAWIENLGGGIGYNPYHEAAQKLPDGVRFDLYTHPQPKRKPLTDEEIDKLCPQFDDPMRREMWIIGFKAAHNIK